MYSERGFPFGLYDYEHCFGPALPLRRRCGGPKFIYDVGGASSMYYSVWDALLQTLVLLASISKQGVFILKPIWREGNAQVGGHCSLSAQANAVL